MYPDGNIYDGGWANNKRHGFGTLIWLSGDKYEGMFVDDKREGKGIYTNCYGFF